MFTFEDLSADEHRELAALAEAGEALVTRTMEW